MRTLEEMTLEEKLGQIFMIELSTSFVTKEEEEFLKKYKLSNYIYFARNLKDYKSIQALSKSLQDIAKENCDIPAFISVDQEGGMVNRIFSGATHFPASMAQSSSKMFDKVETIGQMVGEELFNLGINFNLAPCLDVNNNPNNPVIGVRSYSDNPNLVGDMGANYIKGLQSKKVLASAKHFPGHGDTNVDSHLGLPVVNHDYKRLESLELIPFVKAINNDVASIMTSHIVFPNIDDTMLPATLSKKILTDLLRDKLNFQGLIITDSMTMNAIKEKYTTEKGCVMSLLAGADMVCICGGLEVIEKSYLEVKDAVVNGTIDIDTIDTAVSRILKYKNIYDISFLVDAQDCAKEIYIDHEKLADEISIKSITTVRDKKGLLPIKKDRKVFAISTPVIRANIADDSLVIQTEFAKKFCEIYGEDSKYHIIEINPNDEEQEIVLKSLEKDDLVVFATYNGFLNKGQLELCNKISKTNDVISVSLRIPYDCDGLEEDITCLLGYEYTNRSVLNIINKILEK